MKKAIHIFLIITSFLSLTMCNLDKPLFDGMSCNSDCIMLRGVIIDSIYDTPIEGVEVKIIEADYGSFLYSFDQTIGIINTDENGMFSFDFPVNTYAEGGSYFYTEITKDKYHGTEESIYKSFRVDSTDIDNPISIQLKMFLLTDISLDFTNQSSSNLTDFNYYCSTCIPRRDYCTSFPSDTTINFKREVGVDRITNINYSYRKTGIAFSRTDTITAEKMETYMFTAEIE